MYCPNKGNGTILDNLRFIHLHKEKDGAIKIFIGK